MNIKRISKLRKYNFDLTLQVSLDREKRKHLKRFWNLLQKRHTATVLFS